MREAWDNDGGYSSDELLITSIRSDGKTIVPQRDMPFDPIHYIFEPQGANVKADLPNLKTAEFTATYMGREVTVEKISNVRWTDRSYYDDGEGGTGFYGFSLHIRNGAQKEAFRLYLSNGKDHMEILHYTYLLDGKEVKAPTASYDDILSVEVPEGKSLKEVWSDLSDSFAFDCSYKGKIYNKLRPSQVQWVAEPFHDNKCDKGYYTFTLSITVNGRTVSSQCKLVEKYRGTTYRVSGTLSDADGTNPPAGQKLSFGNKNTNESYTVTTGEGGRYAVDLPEGNYLVFWGDYRTDKVIKVGKQAMTCDIQANLKKASGTITRMGKPMADCFIRFSLFDEAFVLCHTDQNGRYTAYLPENEAGSIKLYTSEESAREDIGGLTLMDYDDELLEKIHQNNNITINKVKICGRVYRKGTTPYADAGLRFSYKDEEDIVWSVYSSTGADGSYEIYLDPDRIYELWADEDEILIKQEVQTGKTDRTQDFRMDAVKIRGTLKTKSGIAVPHHRIEFSLQGKEEAVATYTDSRGKYSMILKPGTYTVKECEWETESDPKLTVGEEDQVQDLTVPLYQVKMTAYNNDAPWNSDMYVEQNGEMSEYVARNTEDNEFAMYVPAGTYTCNIIDSDKNVKTITVTDRDIEQELRFTHQKVTGKIYRLTSGTSFEDIGENACPHLYLEDEDGNVIDRMWATWGRYETYLPGAGTYKIIYGDQEVFSFTTGSEPEITQDLLCKIYKITGTVSGVDEYSIDGNLFFANKETGASYYEAEVVSGDAAGTKSITAYLPAGEYTYRFSVFDADLEKEGELSVSGDQSGFDIAMPVRYEISGTVTRLSRSWKGVTVCCEGEDTDGNEVWKCGQTGSGGSYKISVPAGKYTLHFYEIAGIQEKVTVSDRDQVKDFAVDLVKISGTVTRDGKKLKDIPVECWESGGEFPSETKYTTADYGDAGKYEFYVEPDTSYEIIVAGEKKTVTVAREDISLDIAVTAAKVSGMVTEADGSAAQSASITIYKKDSDGNWTDSHNISSDWEGTYECYLPAGEYYVSYWMATDDAMGSIQYEHGTLTVGTEDITYNIQKKDPAQLKHTVTGTLSGAAGTPWAGVDITFDGNNTVTTNEEGEYSVILYEGEHTCSLNGVGGVEMLTVGSKDMTHHFQFESYVKISGTLTENDAAVSKTSLDIIPVIEGAETEQVMASCTTKEDGSYTFIVFCDNQYKITNNSGVQLGDVIHAEKADIDNHDLSLPKKE